MPIDTNEPGSKEMSFMELKGDELKLPNITLDDFNIALSKCKPSVSQQDIVRHEEFTKDFGQEG